jgi:hypothetical protein
VDSPKRIKTAANGRKGAEQRTHESVRATQVATSPIQHFMANVTRYRCDPITLRAI